MAGRLIQVIMQRTIRSKEEYASYNITEKFPPSLLKKSNVNSWLPRVKALMADNINAAN